MPPPNSTDAQQQAPSPKKQKIESEESKEGGPAPAAAAPNPAAAAAAAAAVQPTIANDATESNLGPELEKRLKELEEKHDLLEKRVDHFTKAFQPATLHALLETSVYEFVSKAIPSNFTVDKDKDKIKYSVSGLCSDVLHNFLSTT